MKVIRLLAVSFGLFILVGCFVVVVKTVFTVINLAEDGIPGVCAVLTVVGGWGLILYLVIASIVKKTEWGQERAERKRKEAEWRLEEELTRRVAEEKRKENEQRRMEEEARQAEEKRKEGERRRTQQEEEKRKHDRQNQSSGQDKDERYYASVLNLQHPFSFEDTRRKYRDLSKQYHPDKVHGLGSKLKVVAENEMKAINEAYTYFEKMYGNGSKK
ncbi:MAG: DnaJ domain-containing protein [Kiritimatiellales bacterium]